MRAVSTIFGILFVLFAIAGIVDPGLWGMHLTAGINAFHMAVGILAIAFGLQASELAATWFCWIVGAVFFGIGVAGAFGSTAASTTANVSNDAIHWILGAILFISGYFSRAGQLESPIARTRAQEPVGVRP